MNEIKDALWAFLGYGGEIEWDYDGAVISGMNDTAFVTIRCPKATRDGKWWVSVYPRVCIDAGFDVDAVGTIKDTDIGVRNWFKERERFIYETLLEILTKEFKELLSTQEVLK